MFEKIKSWSLKKKIVVGGIAVVALILLVSMCSGGNSGGKHTIKYLRNMNTEAARNWADFIEEYGINAITSDNTTILQMAVDGQNKELVETCLKDGADPNVFSGKVLPAVCIATRYKNYEIVKMLLETGANPNPLDKETQKNMWDSAQYDALSELFTSYRIGDDGVREIAKLLIPYYKKYNCFDYTGISQKNICRGITTGDVYEEVFDFEIIKSMFDAGFLPDSISSILVYGYKRDEQHKDYYLETVKKLLKTHKDAYSGQAFSLSNCFEGDEEWEMIKWLIGLGYDFSGDRAINYIAKYVDTDVNVAKERISYFIELGMNFNDLKSDDNYTILSKLTVPIMYSCDTKEEAANKIEMFNFLSEKGIYKISYPRTMTSEEFVEELYDRYPRKMDFDLKPYQKIPKR